MLHSRQELFPLSIELVGTVATQWDYQPVELSSLRSPDAAESRRHHYPWMVRWSTLRNSTETSRAKELEFNGMRKDHMQEHGRPRLQREKQSRLSQPSQSLLLARAARVARAAGRGAVGRATLAVIVVGASIRVGVLVRAIPGKMG